MGRSTLWLLAAGAAAVGMPAVASGATMAPPPGFVTVAADSSVTASDAWARATPGGATTAAAYVMLMGGKQADALVGASTPAAATAEVHETVNDKGVDT